MLSIGEELRNKMLDDEILDSLTTSLDELSTVMEEQSAIVTDIKNLLNEYIHNINKTMEEWKSDF